MIIGKEKNDNDNMHKKIDFSFKDQIRVFVIFLYLHKSQKRTFRRLKFPHWVEDINWMCMRHSEGALDVFWASHVHSIHLLCPGGSKQIWKLAYFKPRLPSYNPKTLRNLCPTEVFRGNRKLTLTWNGLICYEGNIFSIF